MFIIWFACGCVCMLCVLFFYSSLMVTGRRPSKLFSPTQLESFRECTNSESRSTTNDSNSTNSTSPTKPATTGRITAITTSSTTFVTTATTTTATSAITPLDSVSINNSNTTASTPSSNSSFPSPLPSQHPVVIATTTVSSPYSTIINSSDSSHSPSSISISMNPIPNQASTTQSPLSTGKTLLRFLSVNESNEENEIAHL